MAYGEFNHCIDPQRRIDFLQEQITALGGGTTIVVQDEGVTLSSSVTTLNFTGGGVEATDTGGGVIQVDVSTGGSQNLFLTIAVAGQSDIVADSTTDTLNIAAGPYIDLATNSGTDTLTIGLRDINIFDSIAVAGQATVTATSPEEELTLEASTGVIIVTNNTTKTVTFSIDGGAILDAFIAGPGIEFTASEIAVDLAGTDPCLEFDGSDDLQLQINATGGHERTATGVRDKWRYHLVKGLATQAYTPSAGNVDIDGVESVHGEEPVSAPTDELICTGLPLYCDDNDIIVAKYNNSVAANDPVDSWTTDTMANLRPIMAGFDDYDPAENMLLGHATGEITDSQQRMQWKTLEDWLKLISGYGPTGTLYLRSVDGVIEWVTTAEC
jgi:hypothetical protein